MSLEPTPEWSEIPQWDTLTPLVGGDAWAPLNRQAQALANRIEWLRANAGGISAPVNLGNGGTAKAINAAQASAFRINLNQPSCALSITGAGATQSIRLLLVQGSGANKVTWPSGVKWPYGAPPVLSYDQGRTDMVTLETHDGGGTWFGFFNGGGF